MKYYYIQTRIETGEFMIVPTGHLSCCNKILYWLMHINWNFRIDNNTIIRQINTNEYETFYYCQFCGEKHEAIKKVETNNKDQKELDKISSTTNSIKQNVYEKLTIANHISKQEEKENEKALLERETKNNKRNK